MNRIRLKAEDQPACPKLNDLGDNSGNRVKRCPWVALGRRYPDKKDCLASFLALESAEILAGIKPANLFRIPGRTQPCGRNLAQIWRDHGEGLFNNSLLQVLELNQNNKSPLVMVYSPQLMARHLARSAVRSFLLKCGYNIDSGEWRAALIQLRRRSGKEMIPHEIGIFLGYPAKDVAGFIGWHSLPVTCQRLWKIYGPPHKSLLLAEQFENARAEMRDSLLQGVSPQLLFSGHEGLAA